MGRLNLTPPTLTEQEIQQFWKRVNKTTDESCWEWSGDTDIGGYGKFRSRRNGGKRWYMCHRLAWFFTHSEWPDLFILHRCDNKPCCNPAHLFKGTQQDNIDDMWRKGRGATGDRHWTHLNPERVRQGDTHPMRCRPELRCYGEKQGAHKLTERDVLNIRASNESCKHLASQYKVTEAAIRKVRQRKTWAHI